MPTDVLVSSFSLALLLSEEVAALGGGENISLDLESLLRKGPVGVRAGFGMGGVLVEAVCGDGGRCLAAPGEGGRVLELCFDVLGDGVLFGAGLGAGDGERLRAEGLDGEGGRCLPGDETCLSCLLSEEPSAASADTEVVMPVFCCRSILRLRTGPRGG